MIKANCVITLLLASTLVGCSNKPKRIGLPEIDVEAASTKALEAYDKNADGKIAGDELDSTPALKAALRDLDSDGDRGLSKEEIGQRIQKWLDRKGGLVVLPCRVLWNGQPLAEATIRLVPEEFLGQDIKPAEGVTNELGIANIMLAPEDRPDPTFPQGIRPGFFTVQVSKLSGGKEQIPDKYNTRTTLGAEVSYDAGWYAGGPLQFDLRR
jgi:hypothetical protein